MRPFKEDQGVNSVDSASDVLGLGAESIGFRMTFYNRGVLSDPNGDYIRMKGADRYGLTGRKGSGNLTQDRCDCLLCIVFDPGGKDDTLSRNNS